MSRIFSCFLVLFLAGQAFSATVSLIQPTPSDVIAGFSDSTGGSGTQYFFASQKNPPPTSNFLYNEYTPPSGWQGVGPNYTYFDQYVNYGATQSKVNISWYGASVANDPLLSLAATSVVATNSYEVDTRATFFFKVDNAASVLIKPTGTGADGSVEFFSGGISVSTLPSDLSYNLVSGTQYKVVFSASRTTSGTSSRGLQIFYLGTSGGGGGGGVVPEPASAAVFGLLGLVGVARRLRRSK